MTYPGPDDLRVAVVCPSYRRPTICTTHKVLPEVVYYVDPSEAEGYIESYGPARVHSCPPGVQGDKCRVMNYQLATLLPDHDAVLIVDDDISAIAYFEDLNLGPRPRQLRWEDGGIQALLYRGCLMAHDLGAYLWGIGLNYDPQCYSEGRPFNTLSFIGGPFHCHLHGTVIRYDQEMLLKDDYDMTLQHINHYRVALRLNKYHYVAKQGGRDPQEGGSSAARSVEREIRQIRRLQAKWGAEVVRFDTLDSSRCHQSDKLRTFDINPILRVPIKGI